MRVCRRSEYALPLEKSEMSILDRMNRAMALVVELVEPQTIRQWTEAEVFAQGKEDAEAGRVILLVSGSRSVTAMVGGTRSETVELSATPDGLEWSCTCSDGKDRAGCRHFVAVAFETWRRSSTSRR
jgi:uncharacterized Zn finger protein